MPVFEFSAEERRDVTFFLLSLVARDIGSPWFGVRVLPTVANGEALVQARGCLGCHAPKATARDLALLGSQLSAPYVSKLLTFPSIARDSAMPSFGSDAAEGRAITVFLRKVTKEKIVAMLPPSRSSTSEDVISSAHSRFVGVGCVGCHGRAAEGGLPNPNSQGGRVPALVHLADDYTKDEVITIVRRGRLPPLLDPKKPAPPLYMPTWAAVLTSEEILRIVEFPWSLSARNKSEAWQ
jgi:mono/diheme cytochrome c family protein